MGLRGHTPPCVENAYLQRGLRECTAEIEWPSVPSSNAITLGIWLVQTRHGRYNNPPPKEGVLDASGRGSGHPHRWPVRCTR